VCAVGVTKRIRSRTCFLFFPPPFGSSAFSVFLLSSAIITKKAKNERTNDGSDDVIVIRLLAHSLLLRPFLALGTRLIPNQQSVVELANCHHIYFSSHSNFHLFVFFRSFSIHLANGNCLPVLCSLFLFRFEGPSNDRLFFLTGWEIGLYVRMPLAILVPDGGHAPILYTLYFLF